MLKSYCCMRLRRAGIVIGWLGLVGSLLSLTVICGFLGYSDEVVRNHIVKNSPPDLDHNEEIYDAINELVVVNFSILLGVTVLHLVASGLLLLGTLKSWHLMLLPWLINTGMNIAVMVLHILGLILVLFGSYNDIFLFGCLLFVSLLLTLLIYSFCAIYALYKEIQSANDKKKHALILAEVVEVAHQTTTYPNYAKM